MKIVIKSLHLSNFKGIRALNIAFDHVTNISGQNGLGKTSVFDAFTWLFFGKDSTDRKDFEIKTLDASGKVIPMIEHEVSAGITIDGAPVNVNRILKEKWTKKKGSITAEFTGNETLYYWNEVPLQQQEFQAKISGIINETTFKLITNTLYFNQMKWQDRRNVLLSIAGEITNDEIIGQNKDFEKLMVLISGKTIQEYKTQIAARKKKLKDDLVAIPYRIDEIDKNMPASSDFKGLRYQLKIKQSALDKIDASLQSVIEVLKSQSDAINGKHSKIHSLKSQLQNIEHATKNQFLADHTSRENNLANLHQQFRATENKIINNENDIKGLQLRREKSDAERITLREKFTKVSEEKLYFQDGEFACPACKRDFEVGDIEQKKIELTDNFNTDKAKRIVDIRATGSGISNTIAGIDAKIKELSDNTFAADNKTLAEKICLLAEENDRINNSSGAEILDLLENNVTYTSIRDEVYELLNDVAQPINATDNSALKQQKQAVIGEIDLIKKELNNEDLILQYHTRVAQLRNEESTLAQQLADLEGNEFLIEQYTKAKMDLLINRINGKFKLVTFKLFDTQINGGEVECCDTLINGVPFSDANNASKINAGLDIINTLCEYHGVYAPIFIDNRESVNNIIDCQSQVINLIVSFDEKLRVA